MRGRSKKESKIANYKSETTCDDLMSIVQSPLPYMYVKIPPVQRRILECYATPTRRKVNAKSLIRTRMSQGSLLRCYLTRFLHRNALVTNYRLVPKVYHRKETFKETVIAYYSLRRIQHLSSFQRVHKEKQKIFRT